MMNPMYKSSALAVLVLLGGCASAPLSVAELTDMPTTWPATMPVEIQGGDTLDPADPQLAALQAQALSSNRDIAQAALRWQQTQRQSRLSEQRLQPSVGLSVAGSRPLQAQPDTHSGDWSTSYGLSASASYEVDLWDRLAHATTVQQALTEAARTDIAAARALIVAQVAEHYWTQAALAAQVPLAAEQLRISREGLQITTLRVREGKLLPIEIDKAASALQSVQARLADLDSDQQLQRNRLALLLDLPPPGPSLLNPQLPQRPIPVWDLAAPAEVLARRPDVQRARWHVDAALARIQGAQAERYPRLSFSAGVGMGGGSWRDWLGQPLMTLGANLLVPLVDWRRLDLQRDIARTDLDLAALGLRDTVYKALSDVESQLIERERLQQQLSANARRLQEAVQAEQLAELRLRVGTIARLDWLQVRYARLGVEQERLQLQLRAWLVHAATVKALGVEMTDKRVASLSSQGRILHSIK